MTISVPRPWNWVQSSRLSNSTFGSSILLESSLVESLPRLTTKSSGLDDAEAADDEPRRPAVATADDADDEAKPPGVGTIGGADG